MKLKVNLLIILTIGLTLTFLVYFISENSSRGCGDFGSTGYPFSSDGGYCGSSIIDYSGRIMTLANLGFWLTYIFVPTFLILWAAVYKKTKILLLSVLVLGPVLMLATSTLAWCESYPTYVSSERVCFKIPFTSTNKNSPLPGNDSFIHGIPFPFEYESDVNCIEGAKETICDLTHFIDWDFLVADFFIFILVGFLILNLKKNKDKTDNESVSNMNSNNMPADEPNHAVLWPAWLLISILTIGTITYIFVNHYEQIEEEIISQSDDNIYYSYDDLKQYENPQLWTKETIPYSLSEIKTFLFNPVKYFSWEGQPLPDKSIIADLCAPLISEYIVAFPGYRYDRVTPEITLWNLEIPADNPEEGNLSIRLEGFIGGDYDPTNIFSDQNSDSYRFPMNIDLAQQTCLLTGPPSTYKAMVPSDVKKFALGQALTNEDLKNRLKANSYTIFFAPVDERDLSDPEIIQIFDKSSSTIIKISLRQKENQTLNDNTNIYYGSLRHEFEIYIDILHNKMFMTDVQEERLGPPGLF